MDITQLGNQEAQPLSQIALLHIAHPPKTAKPSFWVMLPSTMNYCA
jgi:hypothetical protein